MPTLPELLVLILFYLSFRDVRDRLDILTRRVTLFLMVFSGVV